MNQSETISTIYYRLKPLIPRRLQIWLRSKMIARKRMALSDVWPILEKAGKRPDGWSGWPDSKEFAVVLTHDVELASGQGKVPELIKLEEELGFRSSINFVPERYNVSQDLRRDLTANGFEVGVHGLLHDGKLFLSRKTFKKRAVQINRYLEDWNAVGFRSPTMRPNLTWIHDLNLEYDASTFDTDPFDFQPEGVATIFPFWRSGSSNQSGYIELPTTLPQDFYLFVLMKEKNIDIWRRKLDWIAAKGGMALINTHPDYMNFGAKKSSFDEYPVEYYVEFLNYIQSHYDNRYWHVLPNQIAKFWEGTQLNS